jgi:hypothetical protein
MWYAREIIDLMAAFPGRQVRIGEVASYVRGSRAMTHKQRHVMRDGVRRALLALEETGSVEKIRDSENGWFSFVWKT